MNRLILALAALAALLAGPAGSALADGTKPTLLIMAEDGDEDGIPRSSRISTRVLNELSTQLELRGHDVYDEAAVTLLTNVQGRSRRSDAELVDVARNVKTPPIDVVVFFEVYADVTRKRWQNEVRVRTVGRLLSVADGRRLGNWEARSPEARHQALLLPDRCFEGSGGVNRDCLLEAVGDDARILAQETGATITEKLAVHLAETGGGATAEATTGLKRGFNIILDGFTAADYRDIEEYLVIFSGYLDHRPTRSTRLYHEIWYESTIETAKLQRNLHKMMDLLDVPYLLTFSGNTWTIRAKHVRGGGVAGPADPGWDR